MLVEPTNADLAQRVTELQEQIEALIRQGRKIEAIKRLREQAGMGLGEAKRLREALGREERGGTLSRALLVWLLIAAAETVHGMLRTLLLVPALAAILGGPPCRLYVTRAGMNDLPGLPENTVIERPCRVDRRGIAPLYRPAGLPARAEGLVALLGRVAAFEEAACAAALAPGPESLRSALLLHPWAIPAPKAAGMAQAILAEDSNG